MPNCNTELHQEIDVLSPDTLLDHADQIKLFLGGDNWTRAAPNDATRQKAEVLYRSLAGIAPASGAEVTIVINPDPPANGLDEIVNLAKDKMLVIQHLKRIASIAGDKRPSAKDLQYLLETLRYDYGNPDHKIKFCAPLSGHADFVKRAEMVAVAAAALAKLQSIDVAIHTAAREKAAAVSVSINEQDTRINMSLHARVEGARTKILDLTAEIDRKIQDLSPRIQEIKNDISKITDKKAKLDVQKVLTKKQSEVEMLESLQKRLAHLQQRLDARSGYVEGKTLRDLYVALAKINCTEDLRFIPGRAPVPAASSTSTSAAAAAPSPHQPGQVYYQVENGVFKYQTAHPVSDGEVIDEEVALSHLRLREPLDFSNPGVNAKITAYLAEQNHAFGVYQVCNLQDPAVGIDFDERQVRTLGMELDDYDSDITRAEKFIDFCKIAVEKPAQQSRTRAPVNAFLDVLSLADMHAYDSKQGSSYFKDEIVDGKTGKAQANDSRIQHGLEGQVVTRGVQLRPGEIKRSTYGATGASGKREEKIVIETSLVQSAKNPHERIAKVVDNSTASLTPDEKNKAALKFARELLLQYTEGSGKPIIIRGGPDKADQAARVHAALLMLTAVDDGIKLDPALIQVKVKGCNKPKFFTMSSSAETRQDFYKHYFGDDADNQRNQTEVTTAYRTLRQQIDKENKQANIVEDADADIYQRPINR